VILHSAFDFLAVLTAALIFWLVPMPQSGVAQKPWRVHRSYLAWASLGMMLGALIAGTANLLLSGVGEIGKSILGGLAGAIIAVEILKRRIGVRPSTGLRFAAPLAGAIAVGRLGCFLSGTEDRTFGTPTRLPWGHDFGDGILRHPVQLYEAIAMLLFLAAFLVLLRAGIRIATRAGFHLFIGTYAAQRFLWEFIKPYGTIIGPLNLFHLICLGLLGYAWSYGRAELRHA
jgi:phosphatidylglycerol---prolipoprotein diacylglyceryl transferase